MNGKVRRTQEYLRHMPEAARRIAAYVDGLDQAGFAADTKTQDAVIRNLEIIGEAARNVLNHDPDFAAAHAGIPWAVAYRMRNALSHGYADVDVTTVWSTVRQNVPDLERKLLELLAAE